MKPKLSTNGRPVIPRLADDPAVQVAQHRAEELRHRLATIDAELNRPGERLPDKQSTIDQAARALLAGGNVQRDFSAERAARQRRRDQLAQLREEQEIVTRAVTLAEAEVNRIKEEVAEKIGQQVLPYLQESVKHAVESLVAAHHALRTLQGIVEYLDHELPSFNHGYPGHRWRPVPLPSVNPTELLRAARDWTYGLSSLIGETTFPD
jgi:hypothetical protein